MHFQPALKIGSGDLWHNGQNTNLPSIAVPVVFVEPVSTLVLQHEPVNGIASVEDGDALLAETHPHPAVQFQLALLSQSALWHFSMRLSMEQPL